MQYMLLFLVLQEILSGFKFYGVTQAANSYPFLGHIYKQMTDGYAQYMHHLILCELRSTISFINTYTAWISMI